MEGSVSFTIDDANDSPGFEALVAECNARNLKCGWGIDWTLRDMTDERWTLARNAAAQGHELICHTRHSANMSNQFAFRIQYSGAGAASMSISGDSLTTTTGGTDLNITLSDYDSVIDLVTFIDAQSDYSAETFNESSARTGTNLGASTVQYAGELPTSLFGTVNESDIKTSPVDVSYNTALFMTEEITNCISDIYDNTGVTPTSLIYPGGNHSSTLDETIESYGVNIARLTLPAPGDEKYYPDDVDPMALTGWPADDVVPKTDSEADRTKKALAFFEWVKASGAKVCLWAHGTGEYSQAEWAVVLDAAVQSGVDVKTLSQQATDIRKGARTVSSGKITYSQGIVDNLITYMDNFAYIDNYSEKASGTKHWAGPNPLGWDGEPISDIEPTVGPIQDRTVPFHPTNL